MQSPKLKLFAVEHSDGSVVSDPDTGQPLFFDDKQDAKALRNTVGGHVTYGPDHHRVRNRQVLNRRRRRPRG